MACVANTVGPATVTDRVAEEALDLIDEVVADLSEARRSGQMDSIVDATVDVFQGVMQHVSTSRGARSEDDDANTKPQVRSKGKLVATLKAQADELCNVVTRNSAAGANAVSSASDDFLFNCQKIEQIGLGTGPMDTSKPARKTNTAVKCFRMN